MTQRLTYIEIDVPYCALRYGVGACPAVLGVDSEIKCFNTFNTCPVQDSFEETLVTLRFGKDVGYLPASIECIPSLVDVSFSPAIVSLGENLGVRGTLEATFKDHPDPDTHAAGDPYIADRDYDPFTRGSFWGKWRSRQPWLRARAIRLIRGAVGQTLEAMETRHYVIEQTDGPKSDGTFTITAKDPLKLLDGDRAVAPTPNNGYVVTGFANNASSFTLGPSGIGNAEYPANGYICIGGNEVCGFSRSGDTVNITRGQLGSTARAHEAEERVQVVLYYAGIDPAYILDNLLTDYGGVDPDWIPLTSWETETATYLDRVYTRAIVAPTSVKKLVDDLIEQAALAMWWDDVASQVRLQVLRGVPPESTVLDSDIYMSMAPTEQPEKRVSQCLVYYGVRDPTAPLTNKDNYRSSFLELDGPSEVNYGASALKEIMAAWIPAFGRTTAERVAVLQVGRYKEPPRKFSMTLFPGATPPALAPGMAFNLGGPKIQDATGALITTPAIITRLGTEDARYALELEEAFFASIPPPDLFNRVINIDGSAYNINLRSVHDSIYPPIVDPTGITLTCIIAPGVIVGSVSALYAAFDIGSWVPGLAIVLENNGLIAGAGGNGWSGSSNGTLIAAAQAGGTGLYSRYGIILRNAAGAIWGGGGGGGSGGHSNGSCRAGGGGAGINPGNGGVRSGGGSGNPGTSTTGGASESGAFLAYGGATGAAGTQSIPFPAGGQGGAAGNAIDGLSYLPTDVALGSRVGPQIN